nr:MAG TPA: hypothetical protein [Caudoviricetes sp.]DAX18356.1 MAG TPA: hypothetical protein [Caudoviricetes sp.]
MVRRCNECPRNLLNRCQRTIAYRAVFGTRLKPI